MQAVPSISSGSISVDFALGIGGFPRGRISEIFGPESSGKTTVALQVVAEAQKVGGMAAFIDVEHALDPAYARKLGVDVDNLLVSQPDYGEQALEITNALITSGSIDVLVVDSVAALVPKAELDGEMGDSFMGVHARLMSQAMRKLTGIVSKSNTCLIFINQIREKIGVMFGSPETTTGGRALKFYSSVRADIRRIAAIKDGEVVTGNRTKIKSREEQDGAAVPRSRIRHYLRRGHFQGRRPDGPGHGAEYHRKERLLVRIQRRAHRPGPRKCPAVPEGQSGREEEDRYGASEAPGVDERGSRRGSGSSSGARAPRGRRPRQGLRLRSTLCSPFSLIYERGRLYIRRKTAPQR